MSQESFTCLPCFFTSLLLQWPIFFVSLNHSITSLFCLSKTLFLFKCSNQTLLSKNKIMWALFKTKVIKKNVFIIWQNNNTLFIKFFFSRPIIDAGATTLKPLFLPYNNWKWYFRRIFVNLRFIINILQIWSLKYYKGHGDNMISCAITAIIKLNCTYLFKCIFILRISKSSLYYSLHCSPFRIGTS